MGVTIDLQEKGNGTDYPKAGDKLSMHYVGTLQSDGSKFDSSRDKGKLFEFTIGQGQVIKGWDEGVMKVSNHAIHPLHPPLQSIIHINLLEDVAWGAFNSSHLFGLWLWGSRSPSCHSRFCRP